MGSSHSDSPKFEYVEKVVYVHEQRLKLQNITNNLLLVTSHYFDNVNMQDHNNSQCLDDEHGTRICYFENEIVVFSNISSGGINLQANFYDDKLVKKSKVYKRHKTDHKYVNFNEYFNWLTRSNVGKDKPKKYKTYKQLDWFEIFRLSHQNQNLEFINRGSHIDIYTWKDKKIELYPKTRTNSFISNAVWDEYDQNLVLAMKFDVYYKLEMWKCSNEKWQFQYESQPITFDAFRVVGKITCTRLNFLISLTNDPDEWPYNNNPCICVFAKNTIVDENLMIDTVFEGCHPIYQDDYQDWCQKHLKFLGDIKTLAKMSIDVLKIILSYAQ